MLCIEIVSFAAGDDLCLAGLSRQVQRTFHLPTRVSEAQVDLGFALDTGREQYSSTRILSHLLRTRPPDVLKIVGITDLDLYIPILTFVFGEAQLDGPAAVVSAYRLRPTFHGLPSDPAKTRDRLVKEVNHELAHTFGLIHCPNQSCVMASSTYAENIDFKDRTFCTRCRKLLNASLSSV